MLTCGNTGLSKPCLDHSHPRGSTAQQRGGKFGLKSPKIKFNYAQVQAVCPVLPPGATVSGPLGKAHLFSPQTVSSRRTRRIAGQLQRGCVHPGKVLFPAEEVGRALEGPQHFPCPVAAPTSLLSVSSCPSDSQRSWAPTPRSGRSSLGPQPTEGRSHPISYGAHSPPAPAALASRRICLFLGRSLRTRGTEERERETDCVRTHACICLVF